MNIADALNDLRDCLAADAYFADIPVFTERLKDVENEVQRAMGILTGQAGKVGACCVVHEPVVIDNLRNVPGGPCLLEIQVLCMENVPVNLLPMGTQKACFDIARRALDVLKLFYSEGHLNQSIAAERCLEPVEVAENVRGYVVTLRSQEMRTHRDEFCLAPVITCSGSAGAWTITMTTATALGEIYWCQDGDGFPDPTNTLAKLYVEPFAWNSDEPIRARTIKTGAIGSGVSYKVPA